VELDSAMDVTARPRVGVWLIRGRGRELSSTNLRTPRRSIRAYSRFKKSAGRRRRQFAVERSGSYGAALTGSDARRASRSDRLGELGANAPRPAPGRVRIGQVTDKYDWC